MSANLKSLRMSEIPFDDLMQAIQSIVAPVFAPIGETVKRMDGKVDTLQATVQHMQISQVDKINRADLELFKREIQTDFQNYETRKVLDMRFEAVQKDYELLKTKVDSMQNAFTGAFDKWLTKLSGVAVFVWMLYEVLHVAFHLF